jgi:hypothetical protein
MAKRAEFAVPAGLQELARQFEEWRSSHSGRRPIPEALWMRAADLAREHGVFRTAKVLRLDFSKLKRQMTPAQAEAKAASSAPPAFVEFLAPQTAAVCECVIEAEGPRGRIRIEWKGTTPPDLCGLSRALWEPGA